MSSCRISRVRMKAGGDVRILATKPKDTRFIRTLVYMLDKARRGDVRSFAMVCRIEKENGDMTWMEASDVLPVDDGGDLSMILGGIDRMKARLISEYDTGLKE